MKRIFKRTLAVFLAVVMVLGAAPLAGFVGLELPKFSNPFATKAEAATISETDLFMVYPQYLNAENATRLELQCQMDYLSAFSSCSDDDAAVASLVTSLKDGLDISLNLVTSSLGWTDTYAEKNLKDATMTLLNSTVDTDNALIEAIENVEDVYKPLKKWYSASSAVEGTINKELFISESLSYFMQYTTSESVARHILEDIWKQAEKPATLKAIKKVTGVADEAFTIFQLAIQVSELYAVDLEFINIMMENLDKSSDLYEGLSLIKKDKETNAETYVAKNYFTDKVLKYVGKGLGKAFDYVTGGAYSVVNAVTGLAAYILSNYIYEGKTATEYIQGVHLATFANDLSNSLSKLKSKFIKGTGTAEDIETFKVLFSAYVMAMKAAAQSGYNFASGLYKSACYPWTNIMGNTYTYDAYVKACINQINADISAGKLDTSGNFTSVPSTTYENNVATRLAKVKAKYVPNNGSTFTKEFGYCRGSQGFAGQVFYMLYDIKIKPAIALNKQYEISKEDNLKQIGQISDTGVTIDSVKSLLSSAKVGDLIVAHGKKGVHMMIVSSVGTNGVTVYDCGSIYNGTTSKNNEIREYEFSYGSLAENFSTSRKVSYTGREENAITLKGGITLYRAVNRERIDSGEGYALNYYTYDDSVNYVINNGVLTGYNGSRSVLDIPDEVTSIADNCFKNNTSITQVNLPDNLVSIGDSAFLGCTNLHTVNFNTALKTIGINAFHSCKSLDYAMMGNNVETIGTFAFYNCTSLAAVTLSDKLKVVNGFTNCQSLKEVVIPDSVVEIEGSAFRDCTNLSSVTLSKSLEIMNPNAFGNCTSLTEIEIPKSLDRGHGGSYTYGYGPFYNCENLSTVTFEEGVVEISENLFGGCTGLVSIEIPDTVTRIENAAFYGCTNLISVLIPDSVVEIGSSFGNCTALQSVAIPDSVVEIGGSAFNNCTNLSSVTLSKSLEIMEPNAFGNCTSLTEIEIPKSLDRAHSGSYTHGYGPFYNCENLSTVTFEEGVVEISENLFGGCSGLVSIVIPDTVTRIESTSFYGCSNLKSITIPDSVVEIGSSSFTNCSVLESIVIPDSVVEIGSAAFMNCSGLSSVTLSKSLEKMEPNAFGNCTSLTEIEIPKSLDRAHSGSYTHGYGPFYNCENLSTVTFEEGVVEISENLFGGCSGLVSIVIPDTVTRIESTSFYGCSNLKSITIPDSVVEIGSSSFTNCSDLETIVVPSKVQSVGGAAFQNCSSLKTAEFKNPDTVLDATIFYGCAKLSSVKLPKNLTEIEAYMFYNCKLLKTVNIPSTVKNIGNYAFHDCDTLEFAELPYGLTTIGYNAFYDCDSITKVVIPDSVTSLGSYAFYGCEKLSEIDFGIGLKTIPDSAFRLLPALTEVYLPRFLTTIASNAFAENTKLADVTVPATVTSIQDNSFSYPAKMTFYGLADSYAQTYAENRSITFVDVDELKVDSIKFDKSELTLKASGTGSTFVPEMTISPADSVEPITFSSSDTSIATISNGVITVKGYGTATLTATTESGKTATCTLTINRMVTGVSLSSSTLKIKEGESSALTATVKPTNATNKNVTWISSNEKVATVSNGTVTGVAPGTAIITVKTEDGSYIANCEVTVITSVVTVSSVTVKSKPSKTTYAIGESLNTSGLMLTVKYSDGSAKLVSSGYTVSGFDSSTEGTKTVTVSYGGLTTTFTVTVSASATPDPDVPDTPDNPETTYTVEWIVDGSTTTQTYKEGDAIVKPANPSKSGYAFKGWTPSVPSTMPAYDLTFTAVFEKNETPVEPDEPDVPSIPVVDIIQKPSTTTISYGDAIILHVDTSKIPEGGYVEWSADNGNFKYSANGETCRIDPNKSGSTTFTATIYDTEGNAVSTDTQSMTSKAGFFDKIIAFFKKLFGLTKTIPQAFKNIF